MYQGHHPDGSGVQLHSAGPLYPYVIAVIQRRQEDGRFVASYVVEGPGVESEYSSWDLAVAAAAKAKADYSERNKPVKVDRPQRQVNLPPVGIEANIKGTHTIGVRESAGVRSWFIVGPRANEQLEFVSHAAAAKHIEFLESDVHTIDLQFARRQKAWSDYSKSRNAVR